MLRAELERVARDSRAPARLVELYAALGNDPRLIQESLIRPVLASRLARAELAADASVQSEARGQMERLRQALARVTLDFRAEDPRRTVGAVLRGLAT